MSEQAPQYALDQVTTILRRAYPDPVSKTKLEAESGVGTGDLRAALTELAQNGAVSSAGDDFVWVDVMDRSLSGGDDTLVGQLAEMGDGVESEAVPEEPAGVEVDIPGVDAATGETKYTASIVVEVSFYPELLEGESDDDAAVRESNELVRAAADGVIHMHPTLPVAASLAKVEAFDSPRRVFPSS